MNTNRRELMVGAATLLFTVTAQAGNNPAPLGFELGVATFDEVQRQVGKQSVLSTSGVNRSSGGPMLEGEGEGLGVDGLSKITFIFDSNNLLAGVLMTLPKQEGFGDLQNGRFKKTVAQLGNKYKLVRKVIPFVGDSMADFRQGDCLIRLNAPHLSFTMTLSYLRNDFLRTVTAQSRDDATRDDRRQQDRL